MGNADFLLTLFILFPKASLETQVNCERNISEIIFNRTTSGVIFQPDVTYDRVLDNSLGIADLEFLIKQVHSKFDRFGLPQYMGREIAEKIDKSAILIAFHNKILAKYNSTTTPIRISFIAHLTEVEPQLEDVTEHLQFVVSKTNEIFPNTIDTVLVKTQKISDNFFETFKKFRNLLERRNKRVLFNHFGIILPISSCLALAKNESGGYSDFLLMKNLLLEPIDTFYIDIDVSFLPTREYNETIAELTKRLSECRRIVDLINPEITFGLSPKISDFKEDGVSRYSTFVFIWQALDKFGGETNSPILFFQAFDTPLDEKIEISNTGWWRLIPDAYKDPIDFKFKDKLCLEDAPTISFTNVNVTWLQEEKYFDKEHVGVIEDLQSLAKLSRKFGETDLDKVLETISSKFRIIGVQSGEEIHNFETEALAKFNMARMKSGKDVLEAILLMLHTHSMEKIVQVADNANEVALGTIKRIAFCTPPSDINVWVRSIIRAVDMLKTSPYSRYEWGLCLPVSYCSKNLLREVGALDHFDFLIVAGGDLHLRKKGLRAETAALQHQSMFDSCQMRINSTKIIFTSGWRTEKETDYFGLITFWEMISEWAAKGKKMMLFSSSFDHILANKGDNKKAFGWWRLETPGKFVFSSKREIALNLALTAQQVDYIDHYLVWKLSLGLAAFSLIFLATLATTFHLIRKRNAYYLTKQELHEFFLGKETADHEGKAYKATFYEIEKSSFKIKEIIGSGEFGKVFNATVKKDNVELEVAVKMAKENCPKSTLKGLLSEIKVLGFVEKHENIVGLVGACTSELKRSVVYVFVELCGLGSLESYLRKCYSDIEKNREEGHGRLPTNLENHMKKWSWEIANGLEFIASKKVVHMDIATRNVLLTCDKTAKISDFGLSRRLYNSDIYFKSKEEPLPWRWMPPEALLKCEFTEKSDVWAFGITLWEIFSLGDIPYSSLEWDVNFANYLQSGLRLGTPRFNLDGIHLVISRCWLLSPKERPTFSILKDDLDRWRREAEIAKVNVENADSNYDPLL